MTLSEEEIKSIKEELKWIDLKEYSTEKGKGAGIITFLVPIGCAVTAGILTAGLYYLRKGDSRTQQKLMRYRVLSQGVTGALAALGIFTVTSKSSR